MIPGIEAGPDVCESTYKTWNYHHTTLRKGVVSDTTKTTSNNSLTFRVLGCTASLHVSAHGAIVRRCIAKSYTI
jgi:hypothetical protein